MPLGTALPRIRRALHSQDCRGAQKIAEETVGPVIARAVARFNARLLPTLLLLAPTWASAADASAAARPALADGAPDVAPDVAPEVVPDFLQFAWVLSGVALLHRHAPKVGVGGALGITQ